MVISSTLGNCLAYFAATLASTGAGVIFGALAAFVLYAGHSLMAGPRRSDCEFVDMADHRAGRCSGHRIGHFSALGLGAPQCRSTTTGAFGVAFEPPRAGDYRRAGGLDLATGSFPGPCGHGQNTGERFTLPVSQAKGNNWHELLNNVYCTMAL